MAYREIDPKQWKESPFARIGSDWMLITAEHGGRTNAMTASWGGMGVMWNENVAVIVLRPQRFTKTLVDAADRFSLTFYSSTHRAALQYMGKATGFDEDKVKGSGLTLAREDGVPYFQEADTVMLCTKQYVQPMDPACFVDRSLDAAWYPGKDYHVMYVARIDKLLVRE